MHLPNLIKYIHMILMKASTSNARKGDCNKQSKRDIKMDHPRSMVTYLRRLASAGPARNTPQRLETWRKVKRIGKECKGTCHRRSNYSLTSIKT